MVRTRSGAIASVTRSVCGYDRSCTRSCAGEPTRRAQKNSLKGLVVNVLSGIKDKLSRTEIANNTNDELLGNIGVRREELADKLRQPLGELVADGRIYTIGEKRLMKYHAGPKR